MSNKFFLIPLLLLPSLLSSCEKKPLQLTPEEEKTKKISRAIGEKVEVENKLYQELLRRNALQSGEWKGTYSDAYNQTANVALVLTNNNGSLSGKVTVQIRAEDTPEPSYSGQFTGRVNGDTVTFSIGNTQGSYRKTEITGRWMNENGVYGATQVMYGFAVLPKVVSYLEGGTWILRWTPSPLPPSE